MWQTHSKSLSPFHQAICSSWHSHSHGVPSIKFAVIFTILLHVTFILPNHSLTFTKLAAILFHVTSLLPVTPLSPFPNSAAILFHVSYMSDWNPVYLLMQIRPKPRHPIQLVDFAESRERESRKYSRRDDVKKKNRKGRMEKEKLWKISHKRIDLI